MALVCLPEARWLHGQVVQNDGGGLFGTLGRSTQAWATVDDDQGLSDASGAPMLGGDADGSR